MIAQTKKIGDIEVTALSDGRLATSLDVVLGMDQAEAARLVGTTGGDVHIAVNAFLLKRAGQWALIDAGAGDSMGPALGRLAENLRAFGVAPEEIAAVFLTHIHPDHSNGLVDASGRAIYPNAELIMHEAEARFWLDRDEASGANERIRRNIAKAAVATAPYRQRMRAVREGEAMAGVAAVALPGHTPGHTGWLIASGKESLLIWGDLVHLASVQVARPICTTASSSTKLVSEMGGMSMILLLKPGGRLRAPGAGAAAAAVGLAAAAAQRRRLVEW